MAGGGAGVSTCTRCKGTGIEDPGPDPCPSCDLGQRVLRSAKELHRTREMRARQDWRWDWAACVKNAKAMQTHPDKQGMAVYDRGEDIGI